MENEKDLSLLYLITQQNKEVKEEVIENLLTMQLGVESISRIQELTIWMKNPNNQVPTLLVTDIPSTDRTFLAFRKKLQNTFIIIVHESASDEFDSKSGNYIKALRTIESVNDYLVNESSTDVEFIKRVASQSLSSFEEDANGSSEGNFSDDEFYSEINPALNDIAEYNEETEIEDVPPPSPPQEDVFYNLEEEGAENEAIDAVVVDETIPTESDPTEKDEFDLVNPFYTRARNIKNEFMNRDTEIENSTIGIWSPIHRMGVTSFAINFAFFLKANRIDTVVLEALTGKYAMKDWLKRYTKVPSNWTSYAEAIQSDTDIKSTIWKYRDVMFLPLAENDASYEWNDLALDLYMRTTSKIFDVTLVDFPTGEMADHTLYSLNRCSELWILVDDAIQETIAWKTYIMELKSKINIPVYLVFNKEYSFSQTKRMKDEMGIPMISVIPSLHEETMLNYYETTPLYFKEAVQLKLNEPFTELANHIFDNNFQPVEKKTATEESWFRKYLRLIPSK